VSRGALGWVLLLLAAHGYRLAHWVAGPGEIERRLADRAWLERRPVDYERRPW